MIAPGLFRMAETDAEDCGFLHMDMADLQMKNMVDPDSCDPIFHKPHGNSRQDCLKRALELIDYEACLKEQEAAKEIRIYGIGVGLASGSPRQQLCRRPPDVSTPMLR